MQHEIKSLLGPTQTDAYQAYKDRLFKYAEREKITDVVLLAVLKNFHPSNKAKDAVSMYWYKNNWGSFTINFVNSDGTGDSTSYRRCIERLYGSKRKAKPTLEAMRNTVRGSTKFRTFVSENTFENAGICSLCKKTTKQYHVDHKDIPFKEISEMYLALFEKEIHVHKVGTTYDFTDDNIKQEWVTFHDNIVKYDILCKRCNLSKGARKQPKKK